MRPLAIAVVSGLLVSSFLTLFVVPSFYVILHRAGGGVKRFVLGDKRPAGGRGRSRGRLSSCELDARRRSL